MVYDSYGFLEKNRDTLSTVVLEHLKGSTQPFVELLFTERVTSTGSMDHPSIQRQRSTTFGRDPTKMSVSAHFKGSLLDLMDKMLLATPHFVRCIKPNDEKKPRAYVAARVQQQLQYTGVLETTRIRRDGFSIRLRHAEFLNRYQTLAFKGTELRDWLVLDEDGDEPDPLTLRASAGRIVKRCGLRGAQLGVSLVFLKYFHGEKLMRLLEQQELMATKLTKNVRMFLAQRQLHHLRVAKQREEARRVLEEECAC